MCIIYTIRYLCGHLVHLDNPPITPCSKAWRESTIQREEEATKSANSSSEKSPQQKRNQDQEQTSPIPSSTPPPPPTRYCPIPLLPTIFHSDQVCRVCSAGLLAYARRVYYFEVGCMMLKMPRRLSQERRLYPQDAEDGVDRRWEFYEKNIIDRILSPDTLLKCWVAWRQDREKFRTLAVCGGADGELGRGFRGFKAVDEGHSGFPNMYFFDDFLGGILGPSHLRSCADIEAEKVLQKKLSLLDAVVEARCLEAYALQQDRDGFGLAELWPVVKRAGELRRFCEVTAGIREGDGDGDGYGDGYGDEEGDEEGDGDGDRDEDRDEDGNGDEGENGDEKREGERDEDEDEDENENQKKKKK